MSSKITPPSTILLQFFSIFSTVILILSWLILPFLLYIIFTQSKNLKMFKWTLLNHLFWCLALETVLGVTKPVLLTPAFAGYQIGPFRYTFGNNATGITGGICCAMISSCIFALCATLASRYLLIFPSKLKDWFTVKKFFYIGILIPIIFYILFGITVYFSGSETLEQNFKWAIEYDSILKKYIKNEPTFTFVPYEYHFLIDLVVLIILIFFLIVFVIIIVLIRHQVAKYQNLSLSKLHRSLILMSVMQILITCIFLFIPVMVFVAVICFGIPHTANLTISMLCFIVSHCLIEFIATLYFIHPYRVFVVKTFNRKILRKSFSKNNVIVPVYSCSVTVQQ